MIQQPHDKFAKQFLEELLSPFGEVKTNREVTDETRFVDVLFSPTPTSAVDAETLGLLGRIAVLNTTLLEPFRNQPSRTEVRSCLQKLFTVIADAQRKANREDTTIAENELAQLWIISPSASKALLMAFGAKLDLSMPVMNGLEMIRNLRMLPFDNLPIIVSSASVFESDQHESLEVGGNDFLPKPVQADELFQKLQKHLKFEWIYDLPQSQEEVNETQNLKVTSADSSLSDTCLISPPPEEIEKLFELAMRGNIKGIREQTQKLKLLDEKFILFAEQLEQLAKSFQIEKIREFIQPYRGEQQ